MKRLEMKHRQYKVTACEIIGDYTLLVLFDDGAWQIIDFRPVLHGEMWSPLRDLTFFKSGLD